MKILEQEIIDPKRQNHYWYSGWVATLEKNGYKFYVEARGDISLELKTISDQLLIATVKDKNMAGVFTDELDSYIKDDKELQLLLDNEHPENYLDIWNNNWWECFIEDPEGVLHDLMWVLDDSYYFDEAIQQVKDGADEMIEYIAEKME